MLRRGNQCVALLLMLLLISVVRAGPWENSGLPKVLREVDFQQRIGQTIPASLTFTDDQGQRVTLDQYLHRGPVVLVMAYYDCPMLCGLVFQGVVQSLRQVPMEVGSEIQVVIVSIDPTETHELAAASKHTMVTRYNRSGSEAGWHLLTGSQDSIAPLAQSIGFKYARDENSGQYAHPAGLVLLTKDGVISRYLFGTHFSPRDLRLGLVEASQGKLGSVTDQLMLRCLKYDPMTGRYGLFISWSLRIGGVLTLAALFGFIAWALLRERRKSREAAVQTDLSQPTSGGPAPIIVPPVLAQISEKNAPGSPWDFPLFPAPASTHAGGVDAVYGGLVLMTVVLTLIIAALIAYFAVRYRAGSRVDRRNPMLSSTRREAVWVGAPFVLSLGLFYFATQTYFRQQLPPQDTLDIYVTGKQWMWYTQHPDGRREINQLHVPLGRAVKLIMTSEDVIHSFFIPAFRIKQDVLPGRYTSLWFEATEPGTYHLFCAEYCGADHSRMVGSIVVLPAGEYETWLSQGNPSNMIGSSLGGRFSVGTGPFASLGCTNCHITGSQARAPRLEGIFGSSRPLLDGTTVTADEEYIRESILNPAARIVAGYTPVMPTYAGQIDSSTLAQLVAYIKSLQDVAPGNERPGSPRPVNQDSGSGDIAMPRASGDVGTTTPDSQRPTGRQGTPAGERTIRGENTP